MSIEQVLPGVHMNEGEKPNVCDICGYDLQHGNLATDECVICGAWMCEDCSRFHTCYQADNGD